MGYLSRIGGLAWTIAKASAERNRALYAGTSSTRNWFRSGRNNLGAPASNAPWATGWGHIWSVDGFPYDPDVLAKFGNLELWLLTAGIWSKVQQQERPEGGLFDSSFLSDVAVSWNAKSVNPARVIAGLVEGKFLHFFPAGDYLIPDTSQVTGVICTFEAKIIRASGGSVEADVGMILGSAGVDYRVTDVSSPFGDAFIGSTQVLTGSYRRIYASNLRFPQLRATILPPELAQLVQTDAQGIDPDYVP